MPRRPPTLPPRLRARARRLCAAALAAAAGAGAAGAQACRTTRALVAPSALEGARIRSVRVDAEGPPAAGAGLHLLRRLHRDTRPARVRQELLFAAGDALDTLRVAESMRRLRALGFLDDVALEARDCGDAGVDLTVHTRDTWSATPELKVRSSAASVGVNERNLLGTGTGVRVVLQSGSAGPGVQASVRLPGVPIQSLGAEVGTLLVANGGTWFATLDTRATTTAPTWTLAARVAASEREPRSEPGMRFDRTTGSVLVGRRVAGAGLRGAMLYALAGGEVQRADVAAAAADLVLGPRGVQRAYTGADLGVARVAARFDTLSWLLPRGGLADVPSGAEGEVVWGAGRDGVTGALATHWDGWVGRALSLPRTGTLVVGDAWASGFAGDDLLRSSTVRAALTLRQRARRGGWTAAFAAERLENPDPDVRALQSRDPLANALPRSTRLAEAAVSSLVERGVHLRDVTRSVGLDGALFAAGSYRWDPLGAVGDAVGMAALGAGVRLVPVHSPRATIRLDVGLPVARRGAVSGRPFVALTITPWLLDGRERDGRRLP